MVSSFQAETAHNFFPTNDHPSDLALLTVTIDNPDGFTSAANGVLEKETRGNGRVVRTWRMDQPLAPELFQIAVGPFEEVTGVGPRKLPLRSFVPPGTALQMKPALDRIGAHIEWLEKRIGPFPFATYGVVAAPNAPVELETSTLSLMKANTLVNLEEVEATLVHEAIHHWFGNLTTPKEWSDIWISEGHANLYTGLRIADQLGKPESFLFEEFYQKEAKTLRDKYGPLAQQTRFESKPFNPNVYTGGALALFALREEVGAQTFAKIEIAYLAQHRFAPGSTADYVAVANQVSGRDLTTFFKEWLYSTKLPPMPGHPGWSA